MKGFTSGIIFLISTFALLCPASAGDTGNGLPLTLRDAVSMSLRENLSVAEQAMLFEMAEEDVRVKKGDFDPSLKLSYNQSYKRTPAVSALTGEEERIADYSASLGGKLNTGTAYELKWSNERVKRSQNQFLRMNPYYSSDLVLSVTQPLLKGLGKSAQESGLNVAKGNVGISRANAEKKAEDIISDTAGAYWNLYFARGNYEVSEQSLRLAENLLIEVKDRITSGALPAVEIYKAEAEAALRKENLLGAKKAVLDAEDVLRAVMNVSDWQQEILLLEGPPGANDGLPAFEALFDEALRNRRDYTASVMDKENKAILKKFYENQRLPELNLTASSGVNGLGGTYNDASSQMEDGDYYSWQVGVSLSFPIGNRTARGSYLKAKLDAERAELNLRAVKQKIMIELRQAIRAVEFAGQVIEAVRAEKAASGSRLQAEEERFRLGMATLNDVLSFQTEYAQSMSSEKKAMTDYAVSLILFEKAKGTLLEWHGR